MKKYIRTKDNIYELNPHDYESPMCVDGETLTTCVYTKNHEWVAKSDIIKQADTIKELCDEFVKKSKEIGNDYFEIGKNAFVIFDRKYHKEDLEHYNYYGAIWTDKGLIYVAKMNNEGELELI